MNGFPFGSAHVSLSTIVPEESSNGLIDSTVEKLRLAKRVTLTPTEVPVGMSLSFSSAKTVERIRSLFGRFRVQLFFLIVTTFAWIPLNWTSIWAAEDPIIAIPLSVRVDGAWTVVESSNFRCRCQLPESDARRLAECCETWRTRLRKTWITHADAAHWQPKCDVCVHPGKSAYNTALNRPGDTSVGSTMMNFDQGRAVLRRIDLRADASDWSNAALPHELTHVVLGERFGGHALPRWADEGIAMLSESLEKHRERLGNLRDVLARRQSLGIGDLVRIDRLPASHQRDAFYGQSVALTSLLIRQSTPAQFADFIEDAQARGINPALKQHYNFDGLAALQQKWDQWTHKPENIEFVSLQLHVGLTPIIAAVGDR